MSSLDNYIKFALDIKDQNIVFEDYFFRLVNGYKQKVYQAVLLQPSCPFCGSQELAFDEFKGVDHTLHFICLDADKHEVVQILRTRYKKAIIAYFKKFSPVALQAAK